MKTTILTVATALALGIVAGCDRNPNPQPRTSATPAQAGAGASAAQSNTPTTPANIGQPQSHEEKKEGANPVQGQVDPKQRDQHRDFKQSGDSAGPRGPDTEPKSGG